MRIAVLHPNLFLPELYAGTEVTLHWLCRALADKGHEVVVTCATWATPSGKVRVDQADGYTIVRALELAVAVQAVAARARADVFVVNQLGRWIEPLLPIVGGAPIVAYLHEVPRPEDIPPAALMARASHVANSAVTAAHLLAQHGLPSQVVPPLFGIDQYAGVARRGDQVLFVSLQLRKGADLAIRIAQARPKVSFLFVESWAEDRDETLRLREKVSQIPNITHFTNRPGLGDVLPQVKLLLMPSRSEEAWGRTASEVQFCGVPVLGSRRGNLPATIGAGGVMLDPDQPIERWLDAFDEIMGDAAVYDDLSRKALEQAAWAKAEMARCHHTFEQVLVAAAAKGAA